MPYCLNVDQAKRVYNWFHFGFPDYKDSDICTKEDMDLRDELEGWLIEQGE